MGKKTLLRKTSKSETYSLLVWWREEGRIEMVRQHGYCGYEIWKENLRGSLMAVRCLRTKLRWRLNVRLLERVWNIWWLCFQRKQDFQFVVEIENSGTEYRVDTKSMRLFGLRNDLAEGVHRADAHRRDKLRHIDVTRATSTTSCIDGTLYHPLLEHLMETDLSEVSDRIHTVHKLEWITLPTGIHGAVAADKDANIIEARSLVLRNMVKDVQSRST